MNSDHAPQPPAAPEPPRQNSRTLLLALAAGLGALGILALLRSQPAPDPTTSGTPSGIASASPSAQATEGAVGSSGNSFLNSFSEPQLIVFVPDDNGEMKKRTLAPKGDTPSEPRAAREKLSAQAVGALMQAAPDIFPPGTELKSVSMDGKVATLDFNVALSKPDFWQGSALTRSALDSLAMTVAATKNQIPGDSSEGVRLTVEGKPLPALGEMDLSQPYTPSAQAPTRSEP